MSTRRWSLRKMKSRTFQIHKGCQQQLPCRRGWQATMKTMQSIAIQHRLTTDRRVKSSITYNNNLALEWIIQSLHLTIISLLWSQGLGLCLQEMPSELTQCSPKTLSISINSRRDCTSRKALLRQSSEHSLGKTVSLLVQKVELLLRVWVYWQHTEKWPREIQLKMC